MHIYMYMNTYIYISVAILAQANLKPGAGHGFAPWPRSVVIASRGGDGGF